MIMLAGWAEEVEVVQDRVYVDVLEEDEVVGVMLVLVVTWVELENVELVIELVVNVELDGVAERLVVVPEAVVLGVEGEDDVVMVEDTLEDFELELGATIPYAATPTTATMMTTITTNTKRAIAFLLCITHSIQDCLLK
jgi:hypothetical protein